MDSFKKLFGKHILAQEGGFVTWFFDRGGKLPAYRL